MYSSHNDDTLQGSALAGKPGAGTEGKTTCDWHPRGPRLAPFTLDRDRALASLVRLDDVAATWVLPGHGPAWNDGLAEALRRIRSSAGQRAA
jgi:glyoxylase-like metal-dependent hydrolase (beta-lactamase superfamily II)